MEHARVPGVAGLHLLTVKSTFLKGRADITVYDPVVDASDLPLVILLHGVYGSHWAWSMHGKAHLTAGEMIRESVIRPMRLVMPSDGLYGDGSGYLPHQDKDYEKWIALEVVDVMTDQFGFDPAKAPVFISGLSMGGFGALRLGAKYSGRFRAVSAHSSITHPDQLALFVENFDVLRRNVTEFDGVLDWMKAHRNQLPPTRFDCGIDDPLIDHNRALHDQLSNLDIPHNYEEFPGGHSWEYWELHLRDSLKFFDRKID